MNLYLNFLKFYIWVTCVFICMNLLHEYFIRAYYFLLSVYKVAWIPYVTQFQIQMYLTLLNNLKNTDKKDIKSLKEPQLILFCRGHVRVQMLSK